MYMYHVTYLHIHVHVYMYMYLYSASSVIRMYFQSHTHNYNVIVKLQNGIIQLSEPWKRKSKVLTIKEQGGYLQAYLNRQASISSYFVHHHNNYDVVQLPLNMCTCTCTFVSEQIHLSKHFLSVP